jgi:hypothetical protein
LDYYSEISNRTRQISPSDTECHSHKNSNESIQTFPYFENKVFRSVARVIDDKPLTHKFLLLPVTLDDIFLAEQNNHKITFKRKSNIT